MTWSVDFLPAARDELLDLPAGLRGRLLRLIDVVERTGLEQLHEPHAKHLEGKLWELRVSAQEGIARGIYVTQVGRRVVVLHVFVKKSQKTPARALNLARSRMETL